MAEGEIACAEWQRRFAAALDGDESVGDEDAGAIAAHVKSCDRCRADLGALVAVHMRLCERAALPPVRPAAVRTRWRRPAAAAIACALAAAAAVVWLRRRPVPAPPAPVAVERSRAPKLTVPPPVADTAPAGATIAERVLDVVRDFGAAGDGVADDTGPVQQALDQAHAAGGGVVHFPPGTYLVTRLRATAGLTLRGDGAVLKRAPREGRWSRVLTASWRGGEDSPPLVIRGLTFDGNSPEQGPYRGGERDQQHVVFLSASSETAGRLRVTIENTRIRSATAAGLYLYTNVLATVRGLEVIDAPLGGVVAGAGDVTVDIADSTFRRGPLGDSTPLSVQAVGTGHAGVRRVQLAISGVLIDGGALDLRLPPGSTVTATRLDVGGPFHLYAPRSRVHISASRLGVADADGKLNRIHCPTDLTIEGTELALTRPSGAPPGGTFAAADIRWSYPTCGPAPEAANVLLRDVRFRAQGAFDPRDRVIAVSTRDGAATSSVLTIERATFESAFPGGFVRGDGSRWVVRGVVSAVPLVLTSEGEVERLEAVGGRVEFVMPR